MPQFSPADRETVREHIEAQDFVYKARGVGEGVFVTKKRECSAPGQNNVFASLMEEHGWYVARYTYHTDGSTLLLLPVTEAANEN